MKKLFETLISAVVWYACLYLWKFEEVENAGYVVKFMLHLQFWLGLLILFLGHRIIREMSLDDLKKSKLSKWRKAWYWFSIPLSLMTLVWFGHFWYGAMYFISSAVVIGHRNNIEERLREEGLN